MYSWNLIYKNQSRSDYCFKEEFKHKVLFPSHFHDVKMNYILKIPKLLFTLLPFTFIGVISVGTV